MNDIWSKHIQGANTLYYSRRLRFDDMFAKQYKELFELDEEKNIKILEIGCGPGALAGALRRWYPKAEITAVDLDSEFIRFAKEHESGIIFKEGDITALPFEDSSFDAVISNTVSEHIEPAAFYGEQRRILKPNGVCLVLSSRRGICVPADCMSPGEYEKRFWEKARKHDNTLSKYSVGKYSQNEAELPAAAESFGFKDIRTGFVTAALTPDDPRYSSEFARSIINADRYSDIDSADSVLYTMPKFFSVRETEEVKRIINAKYDARIALYDRGEKQWDTNVSIIMVIRALR